MSDSMCIGTFDSRTTSDTAATTAVGSTVGSIKGNVTVVAGNRYTQTGSDVIAPTGDIRIVARDVAITEAREVTDSRSSQTTRQAGITLAVTSPALAAIQSTVATTEAIGDTGNGRMKALGVASAAMNLAPVVGGLQEMGKNPTSAANVSISLGSSQSSSSSTGRGDSAKGSTVAGRNVAIVATGGGLDSDILVRGSDVTGTKSVTLAADDAVNILAAQSTSEQHSRNSSSAASVGLSIGTQGIMFTASASGARGHADGSDVTQVNSHVGGGELVTIRSGGDTTLAGGVVAADRVVADIGGDLKIRSLQDTAKFDSKQQSLGGSVSVGMGAMSGSVSISQSRVDADYASVREQSGIQAGDGGFDIRVKGNTDLIGGVVASSQAAVNAGKNRFDTASLTTANIQNRDDFNASGFSLGGGYGTGGKGNPTDGGKGATPPNPVGGVNGASPGFASASGHVNSTTTSGVSGIAGNAEVRSGDSSGGIAKTFDADKVNREIGAQLQITSTFLQQAASAWGSYANKRMVDATTPEERACWGADGACRVAGHAVIAGLGGGIGAAIGTAASTGLASQVDAAVSSAGLTGGAHDAVVAGLSAVIGVATGGAAGAAGALNEVTNNYLTSRQWQSFADELGACQKTSGGCGQTEDAAIRARYQNLSTQQNIALANCEKTGNCSPLRADVSSGTDAMLRLAASGAIPVGGATGNDMGQYLGQRLANDPAYRATVNHSIAVLNACNANPDGCTQQAIRAAAITLAPFAGVAGVSITGAGALIGGGLGSVANIDGQLASNGFEFSEINPLDALLAAATGTLTFGATLIPSLFINTTGAIVSGSVGGAAAEDMEGSVLGASIGTLLGYPVGGSIENQLNRVLNPWYRNQWQSYGYTVQRWVGPSHIPSIGGAIGSGVLQELGAANASGVPKK